MNKLKLALIIFLPTLIILTNELVRTFIRPIYGQMKFGWLSDFLGWLPNFLGSLSFMVIPILAVVMVINHSKELLSKRALIALLIGWSILGLAGFIIHEINQDGTRLFYDINDIYATFAGIFLGDILYYTFLLRGSLVDLMLTKNNGTIIDQKVG